MQQNQCQQRQGDNNSTMRAAVLAQPGDIRIERVPIPDPGFGEVRVRLEGCGVCTSNLPAWEGREWFSYPMEPGYLGHEGWGVIDKIGIDVKNFSVGERVAILSNHSYAEYDVASTESLMRLPDSMKSVPFPAEPLGCAINIFRRSEIDTGKTVAIIGIGFLGAVLTRLSAVVGAHVIAISRRQFALDMAKRLGAEETIPLEDHWNIIDRVKEFTSGCLCDVTVEAVGKQWPLDLSAELTRERGRMIVAGNHQDGLRHVNMQLWNWRGFDVISAHEREQQVYMDGIQAAIKAVESGIIDPSPLYTHILPLERINEALDMTRDRPDGFLKALVTM